MKLLEIKRTDSLLLIIAVIIALTNSSCSEIQPPNSESNLPVTTQPYPQKVDSVRTDSSKSENLNVNNSANNDVIVSIPTNKNISNESSNALTPHRSNIANAINQNSNLNLKTEINQKVVPLKIPVAGVRREQLRDTFKDSRSEGRIHDAIDIMAAENTPVIAAADGEIARFFDSERGGITVYQYSSDKKFIYYYAHLSRRAENLQEKMPVKQGDLIGYVGDTGNSGKGNFHLHFAIWHITDPKRYWDGENINPYPLLQ